MSITKDRFAEWRKRNAEEKAKRESSSFDSNNIWFQWGDKSERTIRLVGNFIVTKSHWIGPSKWNPVEIYDSKVFEGEERLPMQVNCNNWDIEKEQDIKGDCTICKLRKISNDILYSKEGKNMPEKEKKYFKDLRYKCDVRTRYFFNCIDRDNPYVNEEEKVIGYKVIEIPWELMDGIISLSSQMTSVDITGIDNGIDLLITRSGGGSKEKVKYSVQPCYDADLSVKKTPLTELEKALVLHDLILLKGKVTENSELRDKIAGEFSALFNDDVTAVADVKEVSEEVGGYSEDVPF